MPRSLEAQIYFGSPVGLYRPKVFSDFAQSKVPVRLEEIGSKSDCIVDPSGKNRIYDYPGAGIKLVYTMASALRCYVNLTALPARMREFDDIMLFVFKEDNK